MSECGLSWLTHGVEACECRLVHDCLLRPIGKLKVDARVIRGDEFHPAMTRRCR